jgi:hypothetical protein
MAEPGQTVVRDHATIVVAHYDFVALEAHLSQIVEACNQPEMSDTVTRLRRYFRWEWDGIADREG